MRLLPALLAVAVTAGASPPAEVWPARFEAGALPPLPALAVGGGEVILEVNVGADGRVAAIAPLRTTPPFASLVTEAVTGWRFVPAERLEPGERPGDPPVRKRVPSNVLVVALFRAPTLLVPTLGEAPKEVAPATDAVPFPLALTTPPYHPRAFGAGVVLLEAHVNASGAVDELTVVRSAPPFDEAALAAVREWKFRPAREDGVPVTTVAYVLLGFPTPVTGH